MVLAIISLGLGIIGLFAVIPTLVFWLCGIFPIALGIAALICGFLAKSRASSRPAEYAGGGFAIGGIIAGALAVVAPILVFVVWMIIWFGLMSTSQFPK